MERLPSTVSDIMSSPVVTIDLGASVIDAALAMTERHIGSIVITDGGRPVGMVTERDILERVVSRGSDSRSTRVGEIMSAPLVAVPPSAGILEAMRLMRDRGMRRLLVMQGDALIGIITEKDVIRAVSIAALTSFSTILRKRE